MFAKLAAKVIARSLESKAKGKNDNEEFTDSWREYALGQTTGERHDEGHSIFGCGGFLGYECFGSAALKSSKFGREPFHCGKCKDRVPGGWILLSPPRPTEGCPLGLR